MGLFESPVDLKQWLAAGDSTELAVAADTIEVVKRNLPAIRVASRDAMVGGKLPSSKSRRKS